MRKLLPLALVSLLSFFSIKSLLLPGYFSMHDDQQVVRLEQFDQALRAGQFPVRWTAGLGFGYGYPLFNFYPPLAYVVGEVNHIFLSLSFMDAIKWVWALALIGSALSMYFFAREFFKETGGIVAATFYLYAPYHAVDAYVRGALAELCSFVWLPLVLLFSYKTAKETKLKYSVITGIFLAILMLTHNLIFLPFMGLFFVWHLAVYFIYSQRNFRLSILHFTLTIIVAFGLTAFFWLPSLAEKQYTLVDQLLIKNLASYTIHFVCPSQFWYSPWGFGGSIAGCIDGMSFMIGKIYIAATIAGLGLAGYLWLRKESKISVTILAALVLLLASAWMATDYSKFVWDKIPLLWYLQFPWRFLEFIVLFASFLAGSLVLLTKKPVLKLILSGLLIGAVVFINAKYFVPQRSYPASDKTLLTDYMIKWYVSDSTFEYLPKGFATKTGPQGNLLADVDPARVASQSYQLKSGSFSAVSEDFYSGGFGLNGTSSGSILTIEQVNFPGWKVWIDGKEVNINDNNPYKLITIQVPPGSHQITGQFTNTWPRTLGNSLSLASIAAILLVGLYGYRQRRDQT